MKNFVCLIYFAVSTLLKIVFLIFLVPTNSVPLHFNISGNADRYGSKWELMLLGLIPFILCLIYTIVNLVLIHINALEKNKKYLNKIFGSILLFIDVVFWVIFIMVSGYTKLDNNLVFSIINIICGMLFMFLGNLMPKLKTNSIAGFRIKATLNNEYIWRKANRLGGVIFVIIGAVGVILGLTGMAIGSYATYMFFLQIVFILLSEIFIALYANILNKKYPAKDTE